MSAKVSGLSAEAGETVEMVERNTTTNASALLITKDYLSEGLISSKLELSHANLPRIHSATNSVAD